MLVAKLAGIFLLLGILCKKVHSLKCPECFSYDGEKECVQFPKWKYRVCPSDDDVCLSVKMLVNPTQKINNEFRKIYEVAYARYCGKRENCDQSFACKFAGKHHLDVTIKECKTLCCSSNTTSDCLKVEQGNGGQGKGSQGTGAPEVGARGDASLTHPVYYGLVLLWAMLITYTHGHVL